MQSLISEKKFIDTKKDFLNLAHKLLNETVLIVDKKHVFRFVEVEFYLCSKQHPDEYTHKSDRQKTWGNWYFHTFANGSFKGGTFKGLDLTLGNNKDVYFGILIRSIQDLKTREIIEGPCKCVNRILEIYGCEKVGDFIEKSTILNVVNNKKGLVIRDYDKLINLPMYYGKRIGLSDKYPEYQDQRYRFLIFKEKIKKQKKDLVQL